LHGVGARLEAIIRKVSNMKKKPSLIKWAKKHLGADATRNWTNLRLASIQQKVCLGGLLG
jgi:hypothetical protein